MNETKDKEIAVIGLFDDRPALERAIDALQAGGFRSNDIGDAARCAVEQGSRSREAHQSAGRRDGRRGGRRCCRRHARSPPRYRRARHPGAWILIAAGPIVAALAGAGAGGAVGTLTGSLIGLGIPEFEAKSYEGYLNEGSARWRAA